MTRKCLIVLTLIGLLTGTVYADPGWGVTTAMYWDWAEKTHNVQVYMRMVRWADLYVEYAITIVQRTDSKTGENGWAVGDFVGCTWIEVCNNFSNLHVDAKITPVAENNVAEHWYLMLTESGYHGDSLDGFTPPATPLNPKKWDENETFEVVDDGINGDNNAILSGTGELNLTHNHGWLRLCVKATGVDPQGLEFDPTNPNTTKHCADIVLTYYPDLPPDVADAASINIGSTDGDATELGSPNWNGTDGGGAGVPGDTKIPNTP
jgi:hypothetical protein